MGLPEFVAASAPLLVPWALQLGSVYALLLTVPRFLSPADYSAAAAALSVYLVLTAASVALQARDTASPPANPAAILRGALAAGLAAIAAMPVIAAALHLPVGPLILLAFSLPPSILAGARIHALRCAGRRTARTVQVTGAAIRLVAGTLLAVAGWGLTGILVGVAIADVVTYGLASSSGHRATAARAAPASRRVAGAPIHPTIPSVASVVLLAQLDLLLARHLLSGPDAGAYAAAGTLTRVLILVPVIGAVLVMRRASAISDPDPFGWLRRSLAASGAAVVGLGVALSLARQPLTAAIFGTRFAEATTLVPILAAVAGLLAIVWQLSYFHVVVASRAHVLLVGVAVLEVLAVAILRPSADSIAISALAGAGTAMLLHYVGARAVARWSPPLSELRLHQEIAPIPPAGQDEVELSIILPCYNPGPALRPFLTRLTASLHHEGIYEIVVVSDGSTDDSVEVARRFPSPFIRVIHYAERAGKGHALRVGLSEARGAFVGFIDADGDIDPTAIGPFLALMRLYSPDIVLGSKRHPMSEVTYPRLRRVMSWIYHKLTRVLFRINVRDTQTGLKLVRRDVLAQVLPRMFEKRYAFDLELLVVARLLGYTHVFEAPVRIDYRFPSSVNPDAIFRILLDTAAIFYRRYILDTYRHAGDRLLLVRDDQADL